MVESDAIEVFIQQQNDPTLRAIGLLIQAEHGKTLKLFDMFRQMIGKVDGFTDRLNEHEELEVRENAKRMEVFLTEIKAVHKRLDDWELRAAEERGAAKAREDSRREVEEIRAKGEAAGQRKIKLIAGLVAFFFSAAQGAVVYIWGQQVEALKSVTAQVQRHEARIVGLETKKGPMP